MLSRRKFLTLAGSSTLSPLLSSPLLAQQPNDEHCFIFVELKGGVHNLISTDFPDPDQLRKIKKRHPSVIMEFTPQERPGFFHEEIDSSFMKLLENTDSEAYLDNGYFAVLPANLTTGEGFIHGVTTSKFAYRLGISGLPLADKINDLSVVRGVFMLGNGHSPANKELYSGSTNSKDHVATVLAKELTEKNGAKPFDNLMIDNAVFFQDKGQQAIAISSESLSMLLANAGSGFSLSHPEAIAKSLQKYVGQHERSIFSSYIDSFKDADKILRKSANAKFHTGEMRYDLDKQLELCSVLLQSGLSRVLTVRMGGTSGFGYFDTHSGLYHDINQEGNTNNPDERYPHHSNLGKAMTAISDFIDKLKTTSYQGDPRKKMIDVVTVVISSEFGRPSNFGGNMTAGKQKPYPLGNGHSYFNNNYILFGKNVNQGTWIGESDPITHFPHIVDFSELNRGNFARAFSDPVDENSKIPKEKVRLKKGFIGSSVLQDEGENAAEGEKISVPRLDDGIGADESVKRALMAKDLVRTIMAIAGFDDKFPEYYDDPFYQNAQIIKPLVKS